MAGCSADQVATAMDGVRDQSPCHMDVLRSVSPAAEVHYCLLFCLYKS